MPRPEASAILLPSAAEAGRAHPRSREWAGAGGSRVGTAPAQKEAREQELPGLFGWNGQGTGVSSATIGCGSVLTYSRRMPSRSFFSVNQRITLPSSVRDSPL
jgi:hypothetical protein